MFISLAVISHSGFTTVGYLWCVDAEVFHLSPFTPANICVGLNQPCDTQNLLLARQRCEHDARWTPCHHHDVDHHALYLERRLAVWLTHWCSFMSELLGSVWTNNGGELLIRRCDNVASLCKKSDWFRPTTSLGGSTVEPASRSNTQWCCWW